jgi:hypothetical protein
MMLTAFGPYRLKMRAASIRLAPCALEEDHDVADRALLLPRRDQ